MDILGSFCNGSVSQGQYLMENPNPTIHEQVVSDDDYSGEVVDDEQVDPFTPREVYNLLRNINDPEHPLTLEQLNVVSPTLIHFSHFTDQRPSVLSVQFTPTIPHCSMATLIGLCIRVRLERSLPNNRFLIKVSVTPGSHQSEADINKQLSDKERVAAALENEQLLSVVNQCLFGAPRMGIAL